MTKRYRVIRLVVFVIAILAVLIFGRFAYCRFVQKGPIYYQTDKNEPVEHVSIIQLIANPQTYDGHRVQLAGYVVTEFECQAIYLDRESYKHCVSANSIGIDHDFSRTAKEANHRYCLISGMFRITPTNYVPLAVGKLCDLSQILLWK